MLIIFLMLNVDIFEVRMAQCIFRGDSFFRQIQENVRKQIQQIVQVI